MEGIVVQSLEAIRRLFLRPVKGKELFLSRVRAKAAKGYGGSLTH